MPTYLQISQAATDPVFAARVVVACLFAAQQVVLEDEDTENHELRKRLANTMLSDPDLRTRQFKWLCASNPGIADSVTVTDGVVDVGASDADIQAVVDAGWNVISGWSPF